MNLLDVMSQHQLLADMKNVSYGRKSGKCNTYRSAVTLLMSQLFPEAEEREASACATCIMTPATQTDTFVKSVESWRPV